MSYAKEHDFSIVKEYSDDGWSGTTFDRPAFQEMIQDIKKGSINLILTKDLSRRGRYYIVSGQYTEFFFPSMNVRFIAVNDGYDSAVSDSDMIPFKNIMNEMYIISFNSTHQAIKCDKAFGKNEIDYTVLPTPREISQSCGMSIRFGLEDIDTIKEIIDQNQIEYKSMYRIFKEDGKKQVEEIN